MSRDGQESEIRRLLVGIEELDAVRLEAWKLNDLDPLSIELLRYSMECEPHFKPRINADERR